MYVYSYGVAGTAALLLRTTKHPAVRKLPSMFPYVLYAVWYVLSCTISLVDLYNYWGWSGEYLANTSYKKACETLPGAASSWVKGMRNTFFGGKWGCITFVLFGFTLILNSSCCIMFHVINKCLGFLQTHNQNKHKWLHLLIIGRYFTFIFFSSW